MTGAAQQPATALAPHTAPTLTSANVPNCLWLVDNNCIESPQLAFHISKCKRSTCKWKKKCWINHCVFVLHIITALAASHQQTHLRKPGLRLSSDHTPAHTKHIKPPLISGSFTQNSQAKHFMVVFRFHKTTMESFRSSGSEWPALITQTQLRKRPEFVITWKGIQRKTATLGSNDLVTFSQYRFGLHLRVSASYRVWLFVLKSETEINWVEF